MYMSEAKSILAKNKFSISIKTNMHKNIKVSTLEIKQKRAVHTVETLKLLEKKYPQHQFFWIVSQKSVPELPKWKDYERIKNQILIVPEIEGISSSIIRERVKKGLSLKDFVPEKIEAYIKKHGLYKNH